MATSGPQFRGFDIGGQHYSNLLDPRTGMPVHHVRSSSVVTGSAEDDDYQLTTATADDKKSDGKKSKDKPAWNGFADDTDLVATISEATCKPGKYSAIWNGLDDNESLVKPGTYTLYIEAARKHGTYQLIKEEITVTGRTFEKQHKSNVDIKAATLSYRKVKAEEATKKSGTEKQSTTSDWIAIADVTDLVVVRCDSFLSTSTFQCSASRPCCFLQ